MKNQTNKILNQSGFSLLEIMVAFLIITIAFIGIISVFPFGISIDKEAENSSIASYLAQAKFEELVAAGYDNVGIGMIEAKSRISSDPSDSLYFYQRETAVAYVDPQNGMAETIIDTGLKKISVTVYFIDAIAKKEKSYQAFILINKL